LILNNKTKMERTNYSSGAKWEEIVGYSRAVKAGNTIEVTGTVALGDDGQVVGNNNAYEQTKFIIGKIEKILSQAGASLKDIVRTRMFRNRYFPLAGIWKSTWRIFQRYSSLHFHDRSKRTYRTTILN